MCLTNSLCALKLINGGMRLKILFYLALVTSNLINYAKSFKLVMIQYLLPAVDEQKKG